MGKIFYFITFSIDLGAEEGIGTLELMPGGKDIEVTSANVYDYVRKYAKYRMLKVQEKAIEVFYFLLHSCSYRIHLNCVCLLFTDYCVI